MNKSLGNHWLALSAMGGLLVSPAFPGHMAFLGLSIVFACMAYMGYVLPKNKRKFSILIVVNFLVGIILRFTPHSYTGGLSGVGFLIAFSVFVPSLWLLWGMFKSEYEDDLGRGNR